MASRPVLLLLLALTGCSVQMAPPPASFAAVRQLGSSRIAPLALGAFTAPAGLDRPIAVRAAVIKPPGGEGFAAFLAETLGEQLRVAGKLDRASPNILSAEITESRIIEGVSTGAARLAARFTLKNGQVLRYDRIIAVDTSWTSSFIGAIAIDTAERNYSGLYGQLVEKLIADPEFQRAAAP